MKETTHNIIYLAKTYAVTVVTFIAAKLLFILCHAPSTPLSDILAVVAHGLSLDLSTALYFLVVPLLAVIVSLWLKGPRRRLRQLLRVYYAFVALAFALAFVADTSLYAFWGFKLDASCLQYLEQPEGITASVSAVYLLVRFVLFVLAAIAIFALFALRPSGPPASGSASPPRPLAALGKSLVFLALTPLMVIGMRGGLSESTTNIGQVYFSDRQFLNHAAVNPVFSFIYSLSHQVGDLSQFQFMPADEAFRLAAGVYTTESLPQSCPVCRDSAAASAPLPADSLLTTATPSVVVIIMESAGEQFAPVMPRLQRLKQEGVCFSECYANSWRTDRGTLSLLSGYPSFPTLSVMKMPEKSRTLPSIAACLAARGYDSHYLYGGDINFTNMRSYLLSTGWRSLSSQDDFTREERHSAKWGVRDDITFSRLLSLVKARPVGQPFLLGYSTLSSHEPWDVPTHTNADPVLNAFAYLDDCLGAFVDSLKASPHWRDLLVVVTADHGTIHGAVDGSTPRAKNHIPMLWLGGAVRRPCTVSTLCNQSDLAATLLARLGIAHGDFTFSRDVLSASYTHPTAVNNYYNAQWLLDASGQLLYDFDAGRVVLTVPASGLSTEPLPQSSADSLLLLNKAILQLTTTDLSSR